MKELTITLLAGIAIVTLLGGWLFLINLASHDTVGTGDAAARGSIPGYGSTKVLLGASGERALGEAAGGSAGEAELSSLQLKACAATFKEAASQGVNLSQLFTDGEGLEPPPLPF